MEPLPDLPETSRAAVLEAYNEPLVIRDVRVPGQLEPNAILVRVSAATICGSDVHVWKGAMAASVGDPLPVILGHEMVGEIVRFGPGDRRDSVDQPLSIGDRIVWTSGSCSACYACTVLHQPAVCERRRYYMFETCEEYPYLTGGFSEYCYVFPNSGRIRVPAEIPSDWASGASCALRTVVNVFERLPAPLNAFQTVVIQGTGPLGLFATALARWHGVERIITIGGPESRLAVASAWGASDIVSIEDFPEPEDRTQRVAELTDGHGAEVVMEFSGARTAFAEGIAMTRNSGQYLVAGQTTPATSEIVASAITRKNLTVSGSWSADASHYWKALRFLASARGSVPFELLFTGEYALGDSNLALERMRRYEETKPVIYPWR